MAIPIVQAEGIARRDALREHRRLLRRPTSRSRAEAQSVALIRVLQLAPEVLLLDEPSASPDPESTEATEALTHAWFEDAPAARAWVWVPHDRAQAARVGMRQLTMRAGVLSERAAGSTNPDGTAMATTRRSARNAPDDTTQSKTVGSRHRCDADRR
jgi:UDP-glucose/iron transport system ATP-binding protein